MRDGILLATDVYRPAARGQPLTDALPVILERTPYNKAGISRSEYSLAEPEPATRVDVAKYFAARGFVVVMQDCRGRYASQGDFVKYVNEPEDGYDTLAWLKEQPWCNGRIGTMGLSYGAHTQAALATQNPPGLACMFMDSGGFADACAGGIRRGGTFELKQVTWAHRHALRSPQTAGDPARRKALEAVDLENWFRNLPWQPGHSPLKDAPEFEAYLFKQWRTPCSDEYWRQPGLYARGSYDQFPDVPVVIAGSWYDPYVQNCLLHFSQLSARHKAKTTLLMGPWTHGNRSVRYAGGVDFGDEAVFDISIARDYRQFRLDFFNRCLGNGKPDVKDNVRYFCMGGGTGKRDAEGRLQHGGGWRSATTWPPNNAVAVDYYFTNDGGIQRDKPPRNAQLSYQFDPADPVPTIGGALTSGEPLMRAGAFDQRVDSSVFQVRPREAGTATAERSDVLVFETDVLDQPLYLAGPMVATLFVSSDCPDTDFTAKLVDLYPDGFAMNISDGILRARYRDSNTVQLLEPDQVYRLELALFDSSNLFAAGHRLRVEISSSNFPQFDLNPNTGGDEGCGDEFRIATNCLHVGPDHPSGIRLSLLPTGPTARD